MIPTQKEYKAIMTERHTLPVYEKLQNARVAVAGLGGLGSNIAISLGRAGVGHLLLVDFDKVDLSNLNRQQYSISDIGRYKTDALSGILSRINPYLDIKTKTVCITESNAADIFSGYSIVCEAFDRADTKAMLINTLLADTSSTVISGNGMAGYLSSNTISTRKAFDRLYICGDGVSDIANTNGLMAPRVAICANHIANMVLRLILGENSV